MRPVLRTVLGAAQRPMMHTRQQKMVFLRAAWPKTQARYLTSGAPPGPPKSDPAPKPDPPASETPSSAAESPSPESTSPSESKPASSNPSDSKPTDPTSPPPKDSPFSSIPNLSQLRIPKSLLDSLPSTLDRRRSSLSKNLSSRLENLQLALFSASRKLNDLTGYTSIESLKKSIESLETHITHLRSRVAAAKSDYQSAIARRSASQREVNELLQRKHAWNATDLERFTSLYRSDHANEQEEAAAHQRLQEAEKEADEAQSRLATSILARYHEEQIWSDKIRRASTWGTWGLMGFNVLLFVVVQLGLEPWKRKRLVGGFEEKVREVVREENERLKAETEAREKAEEVVEAIEEVVEEEIRAEEEKVEEVVLPEVQEEEIEEVLRPDATKTEEYLHQAKVALKPVRRAGGKAYKETREKVEQLFGPEQVVIPQRQLTTLVIEGAVAGAVVSATVLSMIFAQR